MEEPHRSESSDLLHKEISLLPLIRRLRGVIPRLIPIRLVPWIRRRWLARLLVAAVCLASAGLFVWQKFLWVLMGFAFPTITEACQRLRESGLGVTAQDLFCHSRSFILTRASVQTLTLAAGFSIACMILVATGRRASAFLPLIGAIGMFSWGVESHGFLMDNAAVLALLGAPAMAMSVLIGYPRREKIAARPRTMLTAAVVCYFGAALANLVAMGLLYHYWSLLWWGSSVYVGATAPGGMILFAALLGTERRWWPWSLAVVAVMLSGGPAQAWPPMLEPRPVFFFAFGSTLAFFIGGFVWSGWGNLSQRLARRRSKQEAWAAPREPKVPRRFRPVVALNALAVSILIISVIAAKSDTFLDWINAPLPTYLGERNSANDLRTKLDLRQALSDMDAYYSKHGTYRGFDAVLGAETDPALAWFQGNFPATAPTPPPPGLWGWPPPLTMAIISASPEDATIAALSRSGSAFCIQNVKDRGITYGKSEVTGGADALNSAIANCASTPWTELAVHPLAPLVCDGTHGYIICRMVQVLIHNIMLTTNPNSPWPPPAASGS